MSEHRSGPCDVAIIGVACTYARARTTEQFWSNILNKVDAIYDVPGQRFDPAVFYDPRPGVEDKIYCKKGGFLGETFAFNPLKHGTMPRSVEGAEPDQFLTLRTVYEVMQDAGYLDADIDGTRVSFILGRGNYLGAGLAALVQRGMITQQTMEIIKGLHPEFTPEQLTAIKSALRQSLPGFSAETAPGLIPNISTGRVANRLDFMGKNFNIDAACASSLIAAELGIQELLSGRNDMVLCGGVHIFTNIPFLQVFASMRALSPTATIRPFDADCDGTIAGEGIGIVALKRLADAERDGDRIYAVIKGIGSSSDGRAKSVTAPRVEGEELALRRAYEMCGLPPRSIGLIEAHGTGTMVGDQAEAETLRRVFGTTDGPPTVAVGSVKSMIGHAMPAAGAAGLIKTVLALYHRVLPPTLNCRTPLPELVEGGSPFYVNSETRPWIQSPLNGPRRAGVNAFGFGGINAHVVLEEYTGDDERQRPTLIREWESELFVVEADSRAALREAVVRLRRYVADVSGIALRDVAATLNTNLRGAAARVAIVASSFDDLGRKLDRVAERLGEASRTQIKDAAGIYYFEEDTLRKGKVALLFPGEGAQYVNMLADLCIHFPEVRACFESGDASITDRQNRYAPSADIFPPPFFSEADEKAAEQRLWDIQRATEAVLTADGAMLTLLNRLGLSGDMMAGHSAGEWIALASSGILDIGEFLGSMDRLERTYRQVSQDTTIPKMVMLAVGAGRERVAALVQEIDAVVHVANDNCPHQVVVVVDPRDADRVVGHIQSRGVFVERLPYDRGYHTPAFTYICDPLRDYFSSLTIRAPQTQVYCSTTAQPFPANAAEILEHVSQTFARPLLFRQTIERMYEAGARIFVEIGPRGGLTAFVDDILRGQPHAAIATDQQRRPALTTLHNALGQLAALHVKLDLGALYERRAPRTLTWDARADSVEDVDASAGTIQVPLWYPKLEAPEPVKAPARIERPQPERPVAAAVPAAFEQPLVEIPVAAASASARSTAVEASSALAMVLPVPTAEPDAAPQLMAAAAAGGFESYGNGSGHGDGNGNGYGHSFGNGNGHAYAEGQVFEPSLVDGGGTHVPAGLLNQHFALMEELLETQELVMRAFLAGPGTSAGSSPRLAPPAIRMPAATIAMAPATMAPPAIAPAAPAAAAAPAPVTVAPAVTTAAPAVSSPLAQSALAPAHVAPAHPAPAHPAPEDLAASHLAASHLAPSHLAPSHPAPSHLAPSNVAPSEAPSVVARVVPKVDVTGALLAIVSERTGYPTEMLGLDLDMEADLGIDSIKRIEILSALAQMDGGQGLGGETAMEEVAKLKTLRQVVEFIDKAAGGQAVESAAMSAGAPRREPNQPLIRQRVVVSQVPGQDALVLCEIDVEEHRYLLDHCFDTVGSDWDLERTGLPFVPLTVSLEMMAEIAALLSPGKKVVGARNVQALRWIDVDPDGEQVTLAFSAKRTAADAVRVMVWRHRPGTPAETRGETLVDGIFVFGDEYPSAPAVMPLDLVNPRTPVSTGATMYSERQMFHGPRFQGVVGLDQIGENGLLAQLEVLPTKDVLGSDREPVFHTDPFLLDAAGQLVGYWPTEYCAEGFVLFPIRVQELTIYGPVRPVGERTVCQLRIANLTPRQMRADMDIIGADGTMWMRITGWEDWRFSWTKEFYDFWRFPNRGANGTHLEVPLPPGAPDVECRRVERFGEMDKAMWEYLWAHMVLSRAEMAEYRALPDRPAKSRLLYRKAIVKDALRKWVRRHGGRDLFPADIEVRGDGDDLQIAGPAVEEFPVPLKVSVSYDHPVAVAAASPVQPGIELEAIGLWEGGTDEGRLRKDERSLLPGDDPDTRNEWLTRAWCAKKAAAKALGLDIRRPEHYRAIAIEAIGEPEGTVTVASAGGRLPVSTVRDGDYIIALAIGLETK